MEMLPWILVIVGKEIAPESVHYASMSLKQRQELMDEQLESRRAEDRARYANMTPKQRQEIHDRQNTHNRKPEQKQAKKNQHRAYRELRRNTLHKDSLAMTNPFYNPIYHSP